MTLLVEHCGLSATLSMIVLKAQTSGLFSSRVSGIENTVAPMGDFRDSRVDTLARMTAALKTDLEGAIAELDMTHQELQNAQARITQLEPQLAGQHTTEEAEASCPSRSPPRKRLRYGSAAATTRLQ
jgi:hypothetical protein